MAKEIVQTVRKAELSAEKLEKDAQKQKEIMISQAKQKAKELSVKLLNDAQAQADNDIKEAERQSNHLLQEASKEAEKEVSFLMEMAKIKEQAAIDLVISNVV